MTWSLKSTESLEMLETNTNRIADRMTEDQAAREIEDDLGPGPETIIGDIRQETEDLAADQETEEGDEFLLLVI